jgi:hypothetical protein
MPSLALEEPMIGTRSALLAASLFVAAPAMAAPPSGGQYIWVPAGDAVVVVPKAPARQIDFPVVDMFARQEAMMQRMMADMDTMMAMPMPNPAQMIQSVMQGMPQVAPGSSVVMTSISTGNGTCSQTITYAYPVNGGQPVVKVASTGNACGVIHSTGPIQATQPMPVPRPVAPRQHERLWTIGYPPHPIATGTPPRT